MVALLIGFGVVDIIALIPIQGGLGVRVFFLFGSFGGVTSFASTFSSAVGSTGLTLFWGPQDTLGGCGGDTLTSNPFLDLLCICWANTA